ncbi:MAG: fucose isomerase, partial [Clostridiales bacterium]|nr:fucose isomerase [Clostridiales bacterium]
MANVVLGFAPTRRSIFSAPDAIKYADLTRKKLTEMGVHYVDINDIAEDGLLHDDADRIRITAKFREAKVDGLFFPHGNFGTEYEVARLAKELNVPVLLWGPRDERPDENGIRLRDSQCGLFATGKVLRRFQVPFTYLCNCRLEDEAFHRGIENFLAVCNVVKAFRQTRILQIGPRPFDFWSTMCNEGELLEKFNIQLSPVPLPELTEEMKKARTDEAAMDEVLDYCRSHFTICVKDDELESVVALKIAIRRLADRYGCNAAAIQCWNALQGEIGIMP